MNSRKSSNITEKTPEKNNKAVSKRAKSIDKPVSELKGPRYAYNYFAKDERSNVILEGFVGINIDIELGKRWRNISPKKKEKYIEMQSQGIKEFEECRKNKLNNDTSNFENKSAKTTNKKTLKKNDPN